MPGAFAFTTPTTAPTVGTASQGVTFTPTDTLNYKTATTSASVTVSTATATVTLGNLTAIYDGTPKSASATTNPEGLTVDLTYDGLATPPKNAGSYAVVATIVDQSRTGSSTGTLVIAKATPSITTPPSATAIAYGQTLSASTLSGGVASVPGAFAFTTPTTAPTVGTASQGVTFTPTDTLNYKTATTSASVTVSTATPLITTPPTATDIIYGQSLASSTLSGGVTSVPGAFTFTTPTLVPSVGTASQGVTFTPADTANYLNAATTATVNVMVTPPIPMSVAPKPIESWRTLSFSSEHVAAGQAADDMDPDQDGLVNLAEYALGTDPLVFTPPLTAAKNSEGLVLTFTRPRGLSDVLYAADSSDDLIHWNPCVLEMVADGPVQTMRAIDPLTSGNPARRFISLRFTKP